MRLLLLSAALYMFIIQSTYAYIYVVAWVLLLLILPDAGGLYYTATREVYAYDMRFVAGDIGLSMRFFRCDSARARICMC